MVEIKNNKQVATDLADTLKIPSESPYVSENPFIHISNGTAVTELNTILSETKTLMSSFENNLAQDASNVMAISEAYEKIDNEAQKVFSNDTK